MTDEFRTVGDHHVRQTLEDVVSKTGTVSTAEMAVIDGVTAGTVTASKAIVVDANKHIDTLGIANGGLKLGVSGSETAVAATGAELNLNDDQVANVTMAAAAGAANVSEITCTLKDAAGATIASPRPLLFWLSDAATGAGLTATTASGAVTAKAANGQDMGALTAKKAFMFQPLATGIGIVSITDTAKTGFYPCVQLPNGKVVVGTQLVTGNYG